MTEPTETTAPPQDAPEANKTEDTMDFGPASLAIEELLKCAKTAKKELQKIKIEHNRYKKLMTKLINKKKPRKTSDKPTGFRKPGRISKELATFLNLPEEQEMARIDVTNMINKFVIENSLQNAKNRREFILTESQAKDADVEFKKDPAQKLFRLLKPDCVVTYFNLQKWLAPHFIKIENTGTIPKATTDTPPPAPVKEPVKDVPPAPPAAPAAPAAKKRVRTNPMRR